MQNFEKLSRAEMKNVLGGKAVGVSCTYAKSGGNVSKSCGLDLDTCQDIADYACEEDDACDDANCKYA